MSLKSLFGFVTDLFYTAGDWSHCEHVCQIESFSCFQVESFSCFQVESFSYLFPSLILTAHGFLEEPEVGKELLLDPTVVFWLPPAPPKSHVHTRMSFLWSTSFSFGAQLFRNGALLALMSQMKGRIS